MKIKRFKTLEFINVAKTLKNSQPLSVNNFQYLTTQEKAKKNLKEVENKYSKLMKDLEEDIYISLLVV